jgi:putative transposase
MTQNSSPVSRPSHRGSNRPVTFILKQGEQGLPVAKICRKAGISQATYFNWKKKYAGLMPSEMKRLKQLDTRKNLSLWV